MHSPHLRECIDPSGLSRIQRAAENRYPQLSAQQLLARAAGAGGWSTTLGARECTYGTASVPGMSRGRLSQAGLAPARPDTRPALLGVLSGPDAGLHGSQSG